MPGKPPFTITVHDSEEAAELAEIRQELTGREPKAVGDYVTYAIEKVTLEPDFVPNDVGYYMLIAGGVGIMLTYLLSLFGLPMVTTVFVFSIVLLFVGHTADVLHLHANYGHKNSYIREWVTFIGSCIPLIGAGVVAYYAYKRGKIVNASPGNGI